MQATAPLQLAPFACSAFGQPAESIAKMSQASLQAGAARAREVASLPKIAPIPYRPIRTRSAIART